VGEGKEEMSFLHPPVSVLSLLDSLDHEYESVCHSEADWLILHPVPRGHSVLSN
jgi:hypothetical protein